MGFQKSQPAGTATLVPPSASMGPLKNLDASSPARKAQAHEMHEKAGSISNICELPWPLRDDMKKRLPTAPNMMATSGFQRSWVHIHSITLRALRQRATHNNDMAVKPEEGVKLAHGRLQSTLPVRAKTRRQTITSDGTPGLLCLSNPGRRQTAIFLLQGARVSIANNASARCQHCRRAASRTCKVPKKLHRAYLRDRKPPQSGYSTESGRTWRTLIWRGNELTTFKSNN
jgi:hypothetical protein